MKEKFFLFYFRFRKPIILVAGLFTLAIVGLNQWQKYRVENLDYTPWKIVRAESGEDIIISRHDETKAINLCGVEATGKKSKQFLQQVVQTPHGGSLKYFRLPWRSI